MHPQRLILIAAVVLAVGHAWLRGAFVGLGMADVAAIGETRAPRAGLQRATFAGGCFWSVESDFDKINGVVDTIVGHTGGRVQNPTYDQVSRGGTGHVEAAEITFDPAVVTFEQLLERYWRTVDPFSRNRQFCDAGPQYRPVIFVHDPGQRAAAERSKARIQALFSQPIVVEIEDARPFYRAEAYHQDYARSNPVQYQYYRWRCGRDARLAEIWGPRT